MDYANEMAEERGGRDIMNDMTGRGGAMGCQGGQAPAGGLRSSRWTSDKGTLHVSDVLNAEMKLQVATAVEGTNGVPCCDFIDCHSRTTWTNGT